MAREVPWDRIVRDVVPFLVTRQIFAGAGKMGVEGEDRHGQQGIYQIAQRSDFFSVLCSIDTMNRRPLVNTRDEPHADSQRYRRFHVIIGDANMSQWSTALKIGTTALVLELIERDTPRNWSWQTRSRPQSRSAGTRLLMGRRVTRRPKNFGHRVQRLYLAAAQKHCDLSGPDTAWVLASGRRSSMI